MSTEMVQAAWELLREAFQYQEGEDYDMAEELYKRSIKLHPTAEAYTFLGWTYHYQGKLDEAIEECRKAIYLDPDFGTPYNDIGAYLIQKGRHDEAIPWLERAIQSRRYDSYHYPYFNLGRAYMAMESYKKAHKCFQKALTLCPDYLIAQDSLEELKRLIQ